MSAKLKPIADVIRDPKCALPERFQMCAYCGQSFDAQHVGQVYHHTQSGPHEPLGDTQLAPARSN